MEQQKELEKVIVGMRRRLMDEARRFLRNQDEAEDTVQDVVLKLWTMPDRQQAILRMKHVDGMETDEIAALTGMTADSVRQNLSRARRNIMKRFIK